MATTNRLEVRLDDEHQGKLTEIATLSGLPVSTLVRQMIDDRYEEYKVERRVQLVCEMAASNLEDMPEPDELKRQILTKYDFDAVH